MIEEMNNIPKEDDGSLAFLNIPRDENMRGNGNRYYFE